MNKNNKKLSPYKTVHPIKSHNFVCFVFFCVEKALEYIYLFLSPYIYYSTSVCV